MPEFKTRVRIVGDHPHRGAAGTVRYDLPMKLGMWQVDLDDCAHTRGCFAGPEHLRALTATDWTLVREALEAAPCAVTWCAVAHPCSRCAALAAIGRLEDAYRPWFQETCECGWIFRDWHEVEAGCPACTVGVRVDA